jgi:SulP family sulfate permease
MLVLAPLMSYVPLAALAAILVIVAWNMAEFESFRHLMSGPIGDRVV